jgi:hypothetical protein
LVEEDAAEVPMVVSTLISLSLPAPAAGSNSYCFTKLAEGAVIDGGQLLTLVSSAEDCMLKISPEHSKAMVSACFMLFSRLLLVSIV